MVAPVGQDPLSPGDDTPLKAEIAAPQVVRADSRLHIFPQILGNSTSKFSKILVTLPSELVGAREL